MHSLERSSGGRGVMAVVDRLTPKGAGKWRAPFLAHLAESANVSAACKAADVSRFGAYKARKKDKAFSAAWDDALEQGADALEAEARRRAIDGLEEPVFYKGEVCGHVRKYSDTLLMFLLKGIRPQKYRERTEDWNIDFSRLTNEQLERIAAGEHPAAVFAATGASETGGAELHSKKLGED